MSPPSTAARLRLAATARSTLLVTLALLGTVAVARTTPLPEELTVVAWPAFAVAFLVDTALFNELGVAVGDAGFWALFVACCYLEAVLLVALGRATQCLRAARGRTDAG
ncbi:hypothetical protein [Halobaculum marinum]|uniref:Uncharacterized protein n=1 Tax=Halobaculum marinum TaxID=3031996 RepID=A0ABD5WX70_9EURY|nr:hypothetical protein [Halobaculum sp. DT55]